MTGLVFAVGILLMLVGAAAVVTGAPIVQLERGWTEVIAGTVALSGGAVTFAVAVVLVRLRELSRSLHVGVAARAQAPADAAEPVAFESEPLRPTRAPDETVFVAEPVFEPAEPESPQETEPVPDRPSLWKRFAPTTAKVPAEQDPVEAILPETTAGAEMGLAPSGLSAEEPASPAEATVEPELSIEPEPRPRRLVAPSSDLSAVEIDPASRPASYARDWLSQPLLRRSAKTQVPEPPPLFAGPSEREDEAPVVPAVHISRDEHKPDGPRDERPPTEMTPVVAPDPASTVAEVTVIGRYQAGASAYTMYSDGAIDVETEGGDVHRFDSMDELKAFIARQENALS